MSRRRYLWKPPDCQSGKAAFKTQGDALRAMERLRAENAQAVVPLTFEIRGAYRCRCGAWHLTKRRDAVHVGA